MSSIALTIYLGIGAVTLLVVMLWRVCRPSAFHPVGADLVQTIFSAHWIGGLVVVAAWPIAVPYIIWSYRRSRAEQQFIRDDEEAPRS